MRKLIADTIISLDGYFTSPKNEIDWFGFDDEEWKWSSDINRRVDAMLYGRVTYEEFRQFWPTSDPKSMGVPPHFIQQLNDLPKIVFSRTLIDTLWKPATLVREDPGKAVARLKREPGKDLAVVGSGTLVSALLRGDLIDEFFIRIRPIILGAGRPIFVDSDARHPLKLVSAKTFKSGVIGLHYESKRPKRTGP
jgi:dihydrofolate reductase